MSHPLDNLGPYNVVRDGLHAVRGDVNKYYEQISKNAVEKAAPRNRLEGGIAGFSIGVSLISSLWVCWNYMKKRKRLIAEKEAELKKLLEEAMEDMPQETTNEDTLDSSSST